jgi:hypothetical protein
MPDSKDSTQTIEQKTTTVMALGDSNSTQSEADAIMDAMPAFLEKKGVNLQTGERSEPEAPAPKPSPRVVPDKNTPIDEPPEPVIKAKEDAPPRGQDGKFVKPPKEDAPKAPKEDAPKAEKFDDLTDEGINKAVESLKTGKAETKERFATVLRELKSEREAGSLTKKEFEAAKAELAAAKKAAEDALKQATVPEDVAKQQKAEKEELAMFRRQYQLENDPELKKTYDDQISTTEEAISKTLTDAQIPAKAIELIKSVGGWAAFSKSRTPMAWTELDPETQQSVTKKGTQAEYAQRITSVLDPSDVAAIQARVGRQVLLKDQKAEFISAERKKATEYFENQTKQWQEQQKAQQEKIKGIFDEYTAWATELGQTNELLKDEEVPANATKTERESIEAANVDRATIREYITSQRQTTSLDQYKDLVINAVQGKVAEKAVAAAEARQEANEKKIADLEAELIRVRNGGRSTTKGKADLATGPVTPEPQRKKGVETEKDIMDDLDKFAQEHGS